MPWGVVAAGVGAAGSIIAADKAADGQQAAADAATQLQREQFNQTRADNLPALDARNNALLQMTRLAGTYGGVPTAEDVMADPGYQFGLREGRNALENSAAAAGGLYSGATGKALTRYGTDYATTKYNDAFNRLQSSRTGDFNRWASLSGAGQTGANTIADAGANFANNVGAIGIGNSNAQGASAIAQGNAIGQFANQAGSSLRSWWGDSGGRNSPYSLGNMWANRSWNTDPSSWGAINGSDAGIRFKDGGPVRVAEHENELMRLARSAEPSPDGTRPNALLQLLGGRETGAPVPRNRLQDLAPSGPVRGPGGPRDDAIRARLSNGEHVWTAQEVAALGGGNVEAGHQVLQEIRQLLREASRG